MTRSKLFFAAALTATFTALNFNIASAAESQSATLMVEGMTCATCPITVKKLLTKTPGVTTASVNIDTQLAQVTFDPDKTNAEKLAKVVTEIGFPTKVKK